MVVKITNTKINPLTLYYRVPGNEDKRPLVSVHIPSRALNYAVPFSDEQHFLEFKRQNEQLLASEVIIIGDHTKESTAMRINEDNAKRDVAEIREKKEKVVKAFEDAVSTNPKSKTKLKLKVEKDSE